MAEIADRRGELMACLAEVVREALPAGVRFERDLQRSPEPGDLPLVALQDGPEETPDLGAPTPGLGLKFWSVSPDIIALASRQGLDEAEQAAQLDELAVCIVQALRTDARLLDRLHPSIPIAAEYQPEHPLEGAPYRGFTLTPSLTYQRFV